MSSQRAKAIMHQGVLYDLCVLRGKKIFRQSGFTYLTILFVIAFMGVGMAYVGEAWYTKTLREREVELLFIGNQYRKAIERYYRNGPAQYPRSLADLLKDPRKPGIERYLRRAYPDPITGKNEWGILKAPDGGVMGIYSLSEEKPFKKTNFRQLDRDFENTARYADWKFVYLPLGPAAVPQPGVIPVPGQTVPGQAAPGTAAPVTGQAVPGSATPGGTFGSGTFGSSSSGPGSSSSSGSSSFGSGTFGSGSSGPGTFGTSPSGSSPYGSGASGSGTSGSFGSSSSGSGSLLLDSPKPSSPASVPTQPSLTIQPTPSSPSTQTQPSTPMQPAPGETTTR